MQAAMCESVARRSLRSPLRAITKQAFEGCVTPPFRHHARTSKSTGEVLLKSVVLAAHFDSGNSKAIPRS